MTIEENEQLLARIIELETRLTFQDDTIEQLNGVVIDQQQNLDRLESDLNLLKQRLKSLAVNNNGE